MAQRTRKQRSLPNSAAASPANSNTSPRKIARAKKKAEALELREIGHSYEAIAKELGISRTYAFELVDEALSEITREPAERVLQVELKRLDRMQAGVYTAAVEGDQNAIVTNIRLMEHRAKLEKIATPASVAVTGADGTPLIPTGGITLPLVQFIFSDRPPTKEGGS